MTMTAEAAAYEEEETEKRGRIVSIADILEESATTTTEAAA